MTELLAALSDSSPEADERRTCRIDAAFYAVWKQEHGRRGWQADLVRTTGLSRETIRRHVEDERIRRGEIEPTKRYLDEQERKRKRAARDS